MEERPIRWRREERIEEVPDPVIEGKSIEVIGAGNPRISCDVRGVEVGVVEVQVNLSPRKRERSLVLTPDAGESELFQQHAGSHLEHAQRSCVGRLHGVERARGEGEKSVGIANKESATPAVEGNHHHAEAPRARACHGATVSRDGCWGGDGRLSSWT